MDSLEDYPATIKNGEIPWEGSILEATLSQSLNIARAGPVVIRFVNVFLNFWN